MAENRFTQKIISIGRNGFPTSAHFEITHGCNCSCSYCYLNDEPRYDMPLQKVRDTLSILKDNGILYLVLTGGEIFTRPDISAILAHTLTCDFFETNIITNAMLIQDQHICFLRSHTSHFKSIRISIFSDLPEENDFYMGAGNLGKTLANAEKLREAGLRVQLALSVQPFNVHRIGAIMDYYENLGFEISFSPYRLITPLNACEQNEQISYNFFKIMFQSLGEKRLSKFKHALKHKCSLPKRHGLCGGIMCSFVVDPQGTISPCTSFRNYPLGNLFVEPDLRTIFTSNRMKTLYNLSISDYDQCAECNYANFCSLCIGRWHTLFGKFSVIDKQLCNYVKALDDLSCG